MEQSMFDEIMKNAPFMKEMIEKKIEEEKAPLQEEIECLQNAVDDMAFLLLMGGM